MQASKQKLAESAAVGNNTQELATGSCELGYEWVMNGLWPTEDTLRPGWSCFIRAATLRPSGEGFKMSVRIAGAAMLAGNLNMMTRGACLTLSGSFYH